MRRLGLAALVLSLAAGHAGCFWLAVGGAGYGGYKVGTDDRSVGTQVDDAAITSRVKTKLLADEVVEGLDIDVDTYQGVVTLSGQVNRQRQIDRAVALARGVSGVRDVKSRLTVLP